MSPIWTSTAKNDPLNSEMLAPGARFGAPSRTVNGRELSGHYSNYLATSGQMTRNALVPLIASPEWESMDSAFKPFERISEESRKAARTGRFGSRATAPPPPGFTLDQR